MKLILAYDNTSPMHTAMGIDFDPTLSMGRCFTRITTVLKAAILISSIHKM